MVTEHVRLNDLIRLAVFARHDPDWIFHRYARTICVYKLHKEINSVLLPSVCLFLGKVPCSTNSKVRARRKRNQHIPLHFQKFQRIPLNVPFWMSAGAVLDVAAISLMAQPT